MGLVASSPGRLSAGVALLASVLAGCGGSSERAPALPGDAPTSSIGDVGGGQSGGAGEGSLPQDTSEVAEDGEVARSFLQLGRIGPASIVRPFLQVYMQSANDAPPRIALTYAPQLSDELYVRLELLPYLGGEADYELPDVLLELIEGSDLGNGKVGISGGIHVAPSDEGLSVEIDDVVLRAADDTEERLGDGVITGELERRCFVLMVVPDAPSLDGQPVPQLVRDESWSSAFCAQYR